MKIEMSENLINALIDKLVDDRLEAEEIADKASDEIYVFKLFIQKNHPELVGAFVEFTYQLEPKLAKDIVGFFHDETLDLSKIPCSEKDFEPWG